MILTYRYRLLPTKLQHRALETILESQRQLYNAALEERIDAYRKANVTRTYVDQTKALTEWRQSDPAGLAARSRAQKKAAPEIAARHARQWPAAMGPRPVGAQIICIRQALTWFAITT